MDSRDIGAAADECSDERRTHDCTRIHPLADVAHHRGEERTVEEGSHLRLGEGVDQRCERELNCGRAGEDGEGAASDGDDAAVDVTKHVHWALDDNRSALLLGLSELSGVCLAWGREHPDGRLNERTGDAGTAGSDGGVLRYEQEWGILCFERLHVSNHLRQIEAVGQWCVFVCV